MYSVTVMRVALLSVVVIMVTACASGAGTSPTSTPTPSATTSPLATPSPEPTATPSSTVSEAPIGDELTGMLGADSIEGGCAYLEDASGTRWEVVYPDGWEMSVEPTVLRDPEGAVVARAGDTVTVRGHETPEMGSICQIGPIFEANEVVSAESN